MSFPKIYTRRLEVHIVRLFQPTTTNVNTGNGQKDVARNCGVNYRRLSPVTLLRYVALSTVGYMYLVRKISYS